MSCLLLQITKKYVMVTFCFAIVLLCTSCASSSVKVTGDLTAPIAVQVDDFVKRNPPVIYVYPNNSPSSPPKALFMPFVVTQDMEYRRSLGKSVAINFWQTWLSQQAFEVLEFYDNNSAYYPEMALAIGRSKGADLVVGGYITHYLDGGITGDSYVSISVEIYEVSTGNLLWSMAQAGSMEKQIANDFYLFKVEKRLPADPTSYIITILASDMGYKILEWTKPNAVETESIFTKDEVL